LVEAHLSHVTVGKWGNNLAVRLPRSIDTLARPIRYAGAAVPASVAHSVRMRLQAFITI
jgi:hypothetical protein